MAFRTAFLHDVTRTYRNYKRLAEAAMDLVERAEGTIRRLRAGDIQGRNHPAGGNPHRVSWGRAGRPSRGAGSRNCMRELALGRPSRPCWRATDA